MAPFSIVYEKCWLKKRMPTFSLSKRLNFPYWPLDHAFCTWIKKTLLSPRMLNVYSLLALNKKDSTHACVRRHACRYILSKLKFYHLSDHVTNKDVHKSDWVEENSTSCWARGVVVWIVWWDLTRFGRDLIGFSGYPPDLVRFHRM